MDKNSFLIYLDYQEQFEMLTDEQAGQLIKAIIKYEKTNKIPELEGVIKIAFSFIKAQLDRDREKWKEEKQKRSKAGKKGMQKRWNDSDIERETEDNNNITTKSSKNRDVTTESNINNNVIVEDNKNNSVITQDNKNNNVKSVITRHNKNN